MATTAQIIALGNDGAFRQRIGVLAFQIASQVHDEDPGTPSHTSRLNYAIKVIQTPGFAQSLAPILAGRTNLAASTITYNFTDGQVQTDATDAAILSQLATDWNFLAGI